MRYWLLTTEFPPAHGGGISTYCRYTAEMLAERGIAVTVIVADDSVDEYSVTSLQKHLLIVRFNPERQRVPRELGATAGLSYAFFRMVEVLLKEMDEPDVIESQDYLGIAYYIQQFQLLGYAAFQNIPVLITLHAPAFVYLPYNGVSTYRFPDFWTCEMEKHSIRSADMVISPSAFMANEVGRHLEFGPQSPAILANAYRLCEPSTPAGTPQRKFQRNKIVYYGKLSPQKGSFELLSYFKALWDEGFAHPLHIIGGEDIVYHPEQLTMGQWVHRRYGEYVRRKLLILHGKIDPADIPARLADAHIVLLPSIVDNLPFACLESMACEKVVLASMQGGQREIISDGVNGFLFDHREPGSFSQNLRRVLDLDDEEILRIGKNARASLNRYDYRAIAPKKIELLDALRRGYRRRSTFPFLRPEPVVNPPEKSLIGNLLSVVIPFYNLGDYLDDCIRSVLNSHWQELEIIVVNDGSTDESSWDALDRWRSHPLVTVIDISNRGLANARNTGAKQAAGAYLSFLDADDAVLPEYYENAIRVLNQYQNVFFAGSWIEYFGDADGIWPAFPPECPYLLAHNPVNSSALVYKTAAFLGAGLNDGHLEFGLEDYESVVHMARQGLNGVVLPEPLHRYRVRRRSMIRMMNRNKLLLAHSYITEKHRDFYRPYTAEVVQLLNSNGPGYFFDNPTLELHVSSTSGRRSWVNHLKRIVRRHPALKKILLIIKKKTEWIRQTHPHPA